MAQVDFKNVSKRFADVNAVVHDFSLCVPDGELLVLLGPSGCGKSTTLRLLAGLEQPTDGEILLDGQVVNDWSPQRRNVAMVFQNYALYPHMSVRQNLAFPLRMRRQPRVEIAAKVDETARLLELGALLERKPAQLSGGQRQRVAMGRALVRDPAVFLMDEPLSNLDAKLRVQLRGEIARLQQRLGTTTLYVTHDQTEAMTLGHRVAVMQAGVLQQLGSPQELYDRPSNLFVAGFLGSPPMNLFEAKVQRDAQGAFVSFGTARVPLPTALGADAPAYLGLRPEALRHDDPEGVLPDVTLTVLSVEPLGYEQIVYLTAPLAPVASAPETEAEVKNSVAARLPADYPLSAGESITLGIDVDKVRYFDRNGEALG
ncbi:MAG: sn-glycerol-3-phosphate ABC transporter ATP-binding protein UgpC [Pseudomonadota bacterium]|nr:MAG: sn-glycerol-3-phosphate ABC transporter ATP-binding protein UgpC [Pseudomonadota bacterium]